MNFTREHNYATNGAGRFALIAINIIEHVKCAHKLTSTFYIMIVVQGATPAAWTAAGRSAG